MAELDENSRHDLGGDAVIPAKLLPGINGHMREVAIFFCFLLVFIAIGIFVLILAFWTANWNPGPYSGALILLTFLIVPIRAQRFWYSRTLVAKRADQKLVIRDRFLEIIPIHTDHESKQIEYSRVDKYSCRPMGPSRRRIDLVVRNPMNGMMSERIRLAICASPSETVAFIRKFENQLQSSRTGAVETQKVVK